VSYAVKEIYFTLQGEGANTGRAAVFCRFAGCNLWTGREEDRQAAICRFCDTDFVGTDGPGGGKFASARDLARAVAAQWPSNGATPDKSPGVSPGRAASRGLARRFVVLTGGEPLLQLDPELVDALHAEDFEIALETNGTLEPPAGIDWICVSPKAEAPLVLTRGNELKLIYPQAGMEPERYASLDFAHFFLQPMDGPEREPNTVAAMRYCLTHPQWRLSLQTHKLLGIP